MDQWGVDNARGKGIHLAKTIATTAKIERSTTTPFPLSRATNLTLSLTRKALILVAVPVLFELILVGVLLGLTSRLEQARQAESHTREFTSHLNSLMALFMRKVSYSFLAHGDLEIAMSRRAKSVYQDMQYEVSTIDRLVRGRSPEDKKWARMRLLFSKMEEGMDDAVNSYKQENKTMAAIKFAALQQDLDELFKLGGELSQQQMQLQQERLALLTQYNQELQYSLYLSVLGSIILAFSLALYFNHGTTNRLRTLMHNTDRLSAGLAPDQSIAGSDELAKIDRTYKKLHQSLVRHRKKERAILDNAADIICSIDDELRFSDINLAAAKLWGFSVEELIGRRVAEAVVEENRVLVIEKLKRASSSDKPITFDARVIKKGNNLADTTWVATGSQQNTNNKQTVYCVIHDVTERKQIEQLKRDFVSMVSHDLRTPLTSIQMVLSLLEEDGREMPQEEYAGNVGMAKNNVNRLTTLVNNLLDLDKLDSGKMLLWPETFSLANLVQDSISAVQGISKQRKVTVNNQISADLEVYIDRERISQVIINLLSNAIKFSEKGAPIYVTAQQENGFTRINVIDQGRGVPEHLTCEIFERFKQVRESDTHNARGSGLGLAICKAIIKRHHGEIGVESKPKGGSVFWFTVTSTQNLFDTHEKRLVDNQDESYRA